jgi:hypothetical protein
MEESIGIQVAQQKVSIKKIEQEILAAELEVLMLLRDIAQDKERYTKCVATMSADSIEHHHYSVAKRYIEVERYDLTVRYHKKRLEAAKEQLEVLFAQPD